MITAPDGSRSYTVKPGDTLTAISRAVGVPAAQIQEANGLKDPNRLVAGMVLTIPGSQPPPPAPTPTLAPSGGSPTPAPTPTQPTPQPQAQQVSTKDPLYFEETGFRVANEQFWNYFNRRGGVRTFGYPISKEFLLFGFRVQLFQRLIMQLNPDGSVSTMNLLDEGLMPYTRINYSTFPAPDGGMAAAAPKPGTDEYLAKLMGFVKEKAPDQWENLPVNFWKTFNDTVRYEEAYPDKGMDPGIMPAINLELWGAPTSAPAYDPNNKNFVYLRFQRGIMHYDKTNGTTQGLLLGDYLKSIITGVNLPPDLEEQAKGSRFYRQYNPMAANGLNRPDELPGTDMRGAFARDGLVVLDPGHGGTQIGAAYAFPGGPVLVEKDLNLKLANKVADLLRRGGRQVQLTRTSDTQVNNPPRDVTGDGKMTLDDDLQARVDLANNAGADLFLSIHLNGNTNTSLNGAEVYYNGQRPFSDKNKKFAQMVLDNLLASTKAAGFNLNSRGIKLDEAAVGKGNSFYLLGPTDTGKPRATQMVGALVEGAFLTNDGDANMLKQEKFLDALAAGYAQAIQQWFQTLGK
ncbi:MAG: N-acetylmuramoyl-L-alanine amidase [Sphingomonadaceae bacterium]